MSVLSSFFISAVMSTSYNVATAPPVKWPEQTTVQRLFMVVPPRPKLAREPEDKRSQRTRRRAENKHKQHSFI